MKISSTVGSAPLSLILARVAKPKNAKWIFQIRACGVIKNANVVYETNVLVHPSFDLWSLHQIWYK